MSLWFRSVTPEQINALGKGTMSAHMGVVFTEVGEDFLRATLPVDHRSTQYMGVLHGGASAFLAENVASVAANITVDPDTVFCVGQSLDVSHLRPVRHGRITATARPVHRGRTSQVWEVRLVDDQAQLVCLARLTLAVRSRREGAGRTGPLTESV